MEGLSTKQRIRLEAAMILGRESVIRRDGNELDARAVLVLAHAIEHGEAISVRSLKVKNIE